MSRTSLLWHRFWADSIPDPIVWCDRTNGTVALSSLSRSRSSFGVTREQLGDAQDMNDRIRQLLLESCIFLQTRSTRSMSCLRLWPAEAFSALSGTDRDQILLLLWQGVVDRISVTIESTASMSIRPMAPGSEVSKQRRRGRWPRRMISCC